MRGAGCGKAGGRKPYIRSVLKEPQPQITAVLDM